jgi:hypothetical protein
MKESYFICNPHLSEMAQVGALTFQPLPKPVHIKRKFKLPSPTMVKQVLQLAKKGMRFSELNKLEISAIDTLYQMPIKQTPKK